MKTRVKLGHMRNVAAFAVILTMLMTAFCGSWGYLYSYAGTGEGTGNSSTFDNIMNNNKPADFDADDTKNPYSNSDSKFTLFEDDELLLYRSYNVNDTADQTTKNIGTSTYDHYKNGSMTISKDLESKQGGWSSYTATVRDNRSVNDGYASGYNFTKSVAFDPDGTGYDDHVAYVGFDGGGNPIVWVYDTVKKTYGNSLYIANGDYLDNLAYTESRSFLSITAGDYDDDGKDTFVIYFPGSNKDGSHVNCQLVEVSCSGTSVLTKKSTTTSFLHPEYLAQSELMKSDDWVDKLSCDLTTGDFNSDGIDDLGVISCIQDPNSKNLSSPSVELYKPYAAAVFGSNGLSKGSILNSSDNLSTYIVVNSTDSMRSPSISAGDIDNDGYDEFVAGGYYSKLKSQGAGYETEINSDKITAAVIDISIDSKTKAKTLSFKGSTFDANTWTKNQVRRTVGTKAKKDIAEQLSVECVAFCGESAAENVFINGSIYSANVSGVFSHKYTATHFTKSEGDISSGSEYGSSGIIEAVAGVFDDNNRGREQIMLYYCINSHQDADCYFGLGAIYGTNYTDSSNINSDYDSNVNSGCQDGNGSSGDSWAMYNCGDKNNQRLSFCIAAVDCDQDSIVGEYTNKTYTYADPKVAAVLQAGPYFDEIDEAGGYSNSCETAYSVSTEYSNGTTSGDSVSFGVGFVVGFETETGMAFSNENKLGYSLEWNESFENEVSEEYETSWKTYDKDQVIVSRVPIEIYHYKVSYKKDGKITNGGNETMSVSVPLEPTYYTLSIDDYNAFAEEYNKKLEEEVKEFNKTGKTKYGYELTSNNKLKKIADDGTYMPADTTGNPENYWNSWTQAPNNSGTKLSESPMALGYSGGASTSAYSKSETTSQSTEISHGFSFESQTMVGVGLGGNKAVFGEYASLDYLHTTGSFKSTTKGSSTEGTVENINSASLITAGFDKDKVENFGFTWEFGTWRNALTEKDEKAGVQEDYTPFFGYIVYNLKQPVKAPKNVSVTNSDEDSMHVLELSWDKSGNDLVTGYNIYINENGEYSKLNEELIDKNTTSYTISGLDSNTEYGFVVTCYGYLDKSKEGYGESFFSSEATGKTTRDAFELTLDADKGAVIKAEAAGVSVNDGDKIAEDEAVSVEVSIKDGYTVKSVTIKRDGEDDKNITSADGKFNFAMTDDAEVEVRTVRVVSKSVINCISNTDESGTELGTVTATAGGESFSGEAEIYSDSVTLKAEPKDGYVLQKWVIKTPDKDDITIAANGAETYDFGPFAASHEITAYFVKSDDESVNVKISVTCGKNGNIVITDANDKTVAKGAGTYTVNVGKELNFKAVPDEHYKLVDWSGYFDFLSDDTTEYSMNVYENMSIGATFYAPVKFAVSYESNDSNKGTVSSSINSGDTVVPGIDVKVKGTAKDGNRLSGWKILRGKTEESVEYTAVDDGLVKEKEYTLTNVSSKSTVTAQFTAIEKYAVKITKEGTGSGDVYLITADTSKVNSGDQVQYADKLTLYAQAADGSYLTSLTVDGKAAESGDEIIAAADINIKATFAEIIDVPSTVSLVYNGSEQNAFTDTDKIAFTGNTAKKVGEYTATATPKDGYVWEGGDTEGKEIGWSITEKKLTISEEEGKTTTVEAKSYDGNTTATVNPGSLVGICGDDAVTVTATGSFDTADAGEGKEVAVKYTLEGADKDNYTIDGSCIITADINKCRVNVVADNKASYLYEDPEKLTYVADALIGSDTYSGELATDVDTSTTGEYSITQGTLTAGDNYEIVFTGGKYVVEDSDAPTKFIAKGKAYKKSIKYTWSAVPGAAKYKIYNGKCGKKYTNIKTIKGTSYTKKSLKRRSNYKCYVIAYDKNGKVLAKTPVIHMTTIGGKFSNATAVKATGELRVKAGKTARVTAKISAKDSSKKLHWKNHVSASIRYYSTNSKVATVDANGSIKAVSRGATNIYSVAPTGVYAVTKVRILK